MEIHRSPRQTYGRLQTRLFTHLVEFHLGHAGSNFFVIRNLRKAWATQRFLGGRVGVHPPESQIKFRAEDVSANAAGAKS